MKHIRKILIANRGEIAVRVIRTARQMGIGTISVYSDADVDALHTRFADEAFYAGSSSAKKSYLHAEKIIAIAKKAGADAIHPGYGFLSENAQFAQMVEEEGLIFIGPRSDTVSLMGNKLKAKETVEAYGVPIIPGNIKPISGISQAKEMANEAGYPIMVKANAGGGGKGMRIVYHESDLEVEINMATSEAGAAFGDNTVFIEKYIESPRHIEFQVLGDQHGNFVHLFERECSIQRRHQKVLEESPSPVLDPKLRAEMGDAALKVAKSCNYTGAGTVEFILDKNKNFYFLEMNTRLQVEHPVTEMITGFDLVEEQIRIAEGHKLSFKQHEITIFGHAIEARIYAEDPENNFLPSTGKLTTYLPPSGPGIRVDNGYLEQMTVPIHYDPMLAKVIAHGSTREKALTRLSQALSEFHISGVTTSIPFCRFVIDHEKFKSGDFTTNFITEHHHPDNEGTPIYDEKEEKIAAALAGFIYSNTKAPSPVNDNGILKSKWKSNRKL
ncbi:MAG: acetyl-CoA carboxylase biotin carboxylase subunit [Cyclobacteriaceae bacterium]|nr:acetyl-CoA carboxylase biotin carboxylase subunit [Cyclobacteriaceae bacterium]